MKETLVIDGILVFDTYQNMRKIVIRHIITM